MNLTGGGDGRTFVHQCPTCRNWQIEYTEAVFVSAAVMKVEGDRLMPDLTACHQMVEDVMAEHYTEAHPGWPRP